MGEKFDEIVSESERSFWDAGDLPYEKDGVTHTNNALEIVGRVVGELSTNDQLDILRELVEEERPADLSLEFDGNTVKELVADILATSVCAELDKDPLVYLENQNRNDNYPPGKS